MQQGSEAQAGVTDRVARITLNRPARANAIGLAASAQLACAIGQACDAVDRGDARAVLLDAVGERFCAGGDIGEFVTRIDDMHRLIDDILAPLHPALYRLGSLPVPVISAVNGPMGGAGIGLALCADIVLAADTMKLRAGYSAIGLSPDAGASYYLSRRVGAARAKEIFFFNETLGAQDCLRLGIVNAVHPAAELAGVAWALALRAASGPPAALAAIKRLCDGAASRDLHAHLALEQAFMNACARSDDAREGVGAFAQKRQPVFVR